MTENEQAVPTKETHAKKADKIVNVLLICAIALLVFVLLFRAFVVSGVRIEQTSMSPTYQNGDKVWAVKTQAAHRGDVVVFYAGQVNFWHKLVDGFFSQSGENKKLIKRVVALSGDKIWVEPSGDGYVLKVQTEGETFTEHYDGVTIPLMYDKICRLDDGNVVHTTLGVLEGTSEANPHVVAPDSMFVMGDNRYDSVDSRNFGDVSLDRVFGVVM